MKLWIDKERSIRREFWRELKEKKRRETKRVIERDF